MSANAVQLDFPAAFPEIDIASPLQFVVNAAAGSSDAAAKREVVDAALRAGGRRGDLLFSSPAELTGVAQQAADVYKRQSLSLVTSCRAAQTGHPTAPLPCTVSDSPR